MKKILSIGLLVCPSMLFAQKTMSIKLYQNTDIFQTTINESWKNQITKEGITNFSRVSLALSIKDRVEHELEIFIPEFSKPVEDLQIPMNYEIKKDPRFNSNGKAFSFRYEVLKTITSNKKALKFSMGAGLNPYYVKLKYDPLIPDVYSSKREIYGASLNLIPKLSYNLSQRLFIDLSIPVKAFDCRYMKEQIHNPAIPIRQQTNGVVRTNFFENAYTVRLGIAYSIAYQQTR